MWNADKIQNLLNHLRWPKTELAREIGCNVRTVTDWLEGRIPNRSFQIALDHVAEKYNFSI